MTAAVVRKYGRREVLPDAMLRRAPTLVWYVVTRHGERTPRG
jgi:hypothetical protein